MNSLFTQRDPITASLHLYASAEPDAESYCTSSKLVAKILTFNISSVRFWDMAAGACPECYVSALRAETSYGKGGAP